MVMGRGLLVVMMFAFYKLVTTLSFMHLNGHYFIPKIAL